MQERALILAPPRDGALTQQFLADAGFQAAACASWESFVAEVQSGAGVLIVAGELLNEYIGQQFRAMIAAQQPWSDIPVLVVAGREPPSSAFAQLVEDLGNVSLLHRPLSLDTLRSTVSAALRARRRQYQIRDLLRQREESERRREEFLAMLAHELRNPLAPIRTGLEVLRVTDSKDVATRMRAVIERQVGHLSRMIDDLLDVSRITRGKIYLRRESMDVCETLRQAVDSHARLLTDKGLRLDLELGTLATLHVNADPTRLEQMIGNVLSNAIKFTPSGGAIRIFAARDGNDAVIRIRDTGVGIPAHMLGQIFELFAQTDRPLDRTQGGLGIGLTVVKSLAELHGGSVKAFSEGENRGTEIEIRLPALAAEKVPVRVLPQLGTQGCHRSRRILLVEDNRDAADVLATYLRSRGHDVHLAYDGASGMRAALREQPDVVICDIGLPGVDGYELARTLRANPAVQQCLLVAVTGYGEARDRERGLQAGFQHYLTKPANPEEIARLVDREPRQMHASA